MNSGDMLERAYLIACNSGYRDDPGPELALEMACQRGAKALGAADHGVAVGKAADFLLVNVDRAAEAVAMYPPRKRVFKRGRVVAQAGQAIFPILDPGDSAERGCMSPHWLLALAVAVGAAVPMQSAINARMGSHLGHPLYGALTNTAVATLVLMVLVLVFRAPAPRLGNAIAGPWWLWTGGLVGAAFVFGALFVAPRIGAASFAAATIFGTIAASLVIDHFGLFGFPVQPVNMSRLAGGSMVLVGLWLISISRG